MRALLVALALLVAFAGIASAHPGGLNSSGCHNNRKSGDYHCHRAQAPVRTYTPAKRSTPAKPRSVVSAPPSSSSKRIKRSSAAVTAFRRVNACPATGMATGSCPGWEVDHVKPLACGGPDTPDNMQWLTAKANRKKGAMGCRRR